jgi:hypothetical protein
MTRLMGLTKCRMKHASVIARHRASRVRHRACKEGTRASYHRASKTNRNHSLLDLRHNNWARAALLKWMSNNAYGGIAWEVNHWASYRNNINVYYASAHSGSSPSVTGPRRRGRGGGFPHFQPDSKHGPLWGSLWKRLLGNMTIIGWNTTHLKIICQISRSRILMIVSYDQLTKIRKLTFKS